MAVTQTLIEGLASWCLSSPTLQQSRESARRQFFGEDDPRPVKYLPGAEDLDGKERRFLGWFAYNFTLPDGQHPAEVAAYSLLREPDLSQAVNTIRGVRYVLAVTTAVVPGEGVRLELEEETFEVHSRLLSRVLRREDAVCLHLLPARKGIWLAGPGWFVWPVRFGPGVRSRLRKFQLDPIEAERFLQRRGSREPKGQVGLPKDTTLEAAVARMTEAAQKEGRTGLVLPVEEWQRMVLRHMSAEDFEGFTQQIIRRLGNVPSLEGLNRWLALSMNIWNTTPQPDRGGRTAYELSRQQIIPDD